MAVRVAAARVPRLSGVAAVSDKREWFGCPTCSVWYSRSMRPAYCSNCGYETVREGDTRRRRRDPRFDPEALRQAWIDRGLMPDGTIRT